MEFRYLPTTKMNAIPKTSGVYAFFSKNKILYIGKASNLRERIENHFQQPSWRDNLFITKINRIGYIKTDSDIDALLLESQLIKKYKPKYNVMWKDDKKYFYVGINPSTQLKTGRGYFWRVFLTHPPVKEEKIQSKESRAEYIGPFVDGTALKHVMRVLRRIFPYYTQKTHPVLACSWCHINLCPGPNPDKREYKKNIQNLIRILKGKGSSLLKKIEKAMKEASRNADFEKAAQLRDQWLALQKVFSHKFQESKPVPGNVSLYLQKLFETKRNISRIEAYDISNIQGQEATGSQVTFIDGNPAKEWYRRFKIHISGKANDFAMMRELISRRLSHPEWPYPDLMIIDGGKAQLNAGILTLQKSKIKRQKAKIFLAALAKRQNELFLPNRKKPILLKDLPRSVQNLILHIRDEAHRFAVSYHRKLRKKRIFS